MTVGVITDTDKAWMAAVIDVKGATVRKKSRSRSTPQVVLTARMKDARVARKLGMLTGVMPELRENSKLSETLRRGCAEHCPDAHVHVDSAYPWSIPDITYWTLTGVAAAIVLMDLSEYMTTYDDYTADVQLIIDNAVTSGRGVGMVRSSVERLRELGWSIPFQLDPKLSTPATLTAVPG